MCPLAVNKHPNNEQGIPDFWLASFMKLEVNNQHMLSGNTAGKSTYLFHNQSPPRKKVYHDLHMLGRLHPKGLLKFCSV